MARLSKSTSELEGGSAAYAGGTRLTNDDCCCSQSKMEECINDETGIDGIESCSMWIWIGTANAILLMLRRGMRQDCSPGAERKAAKVS